MPSTGTGLKVLSILQNHYVERMGKGLVVNMPYVSSWSISLITRTPGPPTYQFAKSLPLASALSRCCTLHITHQGSIALLRFHLPFCSCSATHPFDTLSHITRICLDAALSPPCLGVLLQPADTPDGGSTRFLVSSAVQWTPSLGTRSDSTQT